MVAIISLLKLELCEGVFFVKQDEVMDEYLNRYIGGEESLIDYMYHDRTDPSDTIGMDGMWINGDDSNEDRILSHVYTNVDDGTDPFEQFQKMGMLPDVKK